MLRDSVGVIDISNFGKYSVKGAGAEYWLNAVFANKMPSVVGRSCLTPLIGKRGGIAGDATVTKLGEDDYWVVSSGMAERYQQRFYQMVDLPEALAGVKSLRAQSRLGKINMDALEQEEYDKAIDEQRVKIADWMTPDMPPILD